jgi:hypothetical protein
MLEFCVLQLIHFYQFAYEQLIIHPSIATFANIWIFIMNMVTLYFLPNISKSKRRVAFVTGLCTQPAWIYLTITDKNYGVFIISILYTITYIRGIVSHWKVTESESTA